MTAKTVVTELGLQQLEESLAHWIEMLKVVTVDDVHTLSFVGTRLSNATLEWDWNLSLAKWVKLIRECQAGRVVGGGGAYTCGLCMRFFEDWCDDCPIPLAGDEYPKCISTPQPRYVAELMRPDEEPSLDALLTHALAELSFLLDLHQQWTEANNEDR